MFPGNLQNENKGFIYELEAIAAVQGVLALCKNVKHSDVVLFCDNEAGLSALIKCKSEAPTVKSALLELTMFEEEHDLNIWFERVASSSNPADAPSRGITSHLPQSFRVNVSL